MKRFYFFILCVVAGFFSCNNESNLFPTLDNDQYAFFVADALDAMNMPRPEGSYNYPCLPGMLSWKALKTADEMKQVCRVPKSVLEKQSTQAVIQAIWEHPDFSMFISWRSDSRMQPSLDRYLSDWDAYLELTKRPDAASCLLQRYVRMNVTKTTHVFFNNSLQLLLSQYVFIDQLSLKEKVQLATEMLDRIEQLKKQLDVEETSNLYSIESSCFCLVRLMVSCKYIPMVDAIKADEKIREFEQTGDCSFLIDAGFRKNILDLAANFIKEN